LLFLRTFCGGKKYQKPLVFINSFAPLAIAALRLTLDSIKTQRQRIITRYARRIGLFWGKFFIFDKKRAYKNQQFINFYGGFCPKNQIVN